MQNLLKVITVISMYALHTYNSIYLPNKVPCRVENWENLILNIITIVHCPYNYIQLYFLEYCGKN